MNYLPGVKQPSTRATTFSVARHADGADGPWEETRFGDVVVRARRPSDEQIRIYAKQSTEALRRAFEVLAKPGIHLEAKKDVPLYSADPDTLGLFIRELNGNVQRGTFQDGQFKAID